MMIVSDHFAIISLEDLSKFLIPLFSNIIFLNLIQIDKKQKCSNKTKPMSKRVYLGSRLESLLSMLSLCYAVPAF